MKSPENVAVNADGIAVADYDSGAVHYFEHDGRLRWTYKLPLAHGVAIAYGHVYGASLSSEGLVKLEPATGAVVARNKTYGQKGFIYPTAMFSTKDSPFKGDLVVIDANRGAVIFIDRDLQIADQYGRNSRHLWLRPYGAEIIGARMLVADTENFRLVWLTASYEVTSAFDDLGKIHVGRAKEVGMDGRQCGYESLGPLPGLPRDMRFHAGWQGACGVVDNQAQGLSVVFPAYGQLGKRPPQFFNQLWRGIVEHKGTTYSVFGSPSRSVYMVVRGDDYIFVQLDPRITIWGPEGADGELSEIAEKAQTEFALFDGYKERCGTMSAILTYGEFKGTLAEAMDRVLLYPSAKEIARKWTAGEAVTDAAVTDYIRRTVNGSYVSIDDIALLRSMVGYRFDDMARHFQACQ